MIERFGAFEGFVGESFEGSDGADSSDIAAIYIYCHMVRTPWE